MTENRSLLRPPAALALACCGALACLPRGDLGEYSGGDGPSGGGGASPAAANPSSGDPGSGAAGSSASDVDAGSGGAPPGPELDAAAPVTGAAGAGGATSGDPGAATGPRVSTTIPADGAVGVRRDTPLSIAFDEPMDRASVEAAFRFDSLPELPLEFHWDSTGTLLDVVLGAPLAYSTGSDPALVAALRYDYTLSSAARDLAGHALPETRVSFATLREITLLVAAQADATQTGNWRSDGIYGTDSCAQAGTQICLGDSSFGPNASYSGFASFDLSVLPATTVELSLGQLELQIVSVLGTPSASLGLLLAEHVDFTAIGPGAFDAPASGQFLSAGSVSAGSTPSFEVLSALREDWQSAVPARFRLRFQTATDADGATDLAFATRSSARLSLRYLLP